MYDIEVVKNTQGYNDWVAATKSTGVASPQPQAANPQKSTTGYTAAPKSSYPTDEERAKTQVYIVRQSNITAAINTLSVGAKTLKVDDILTLAKRYEDHVFGTSQEKYSDNIAKASPAVPFDAATAFDDLDDLPQ